MTNKEVVENFMKRKSGQSLNMRSDGNKLFSYQTCMAEWVDNILFVNFTKYSRTTSKQMSPLYREVRKPQYDFSVAFIENLPYEIDSILEYAEGDE